MRPALVLAPLALALLAGCGGPTPADVSGTVLIDGTPLADGEILFVPADGKSGPDAGPIKDGKYTIKATPGSKKVQIKASRPTAKVDPVMGAAAKESMIGPEYNDQTTLTAEIKAGKNEGVDFKVKALPKGK